MKANEIPEKIYFGEADKSVLDIYSTKEHDDEVEYIRTDVFIEKACGWIKENITNKPNANSILARNGCVTLGMLIEDFKNYMEDKL